MAGRRNQCKLFSIRNMPAPSVVRDCRDMCIESIGSVIQTRTLKTTNSIYPSIQPAATLSLFAPVSLSRLLCLYILTRRTCWDLAFLFMPSNAGDLNWFWCDLLGMSSMWPLLVGPVYSTYNGRQCNTGTKHHYNVCMYAYVVCVWMGFGLIMRIVCRAIFKTRLTHTAREWRVDGH